MVVELNLAEDKRRDGRVFLVRRGSEAQSRWMRNKRELEQLSDRVLERAREDAPPEACVAPRSSAVAFRQGEREDTSQPFLETAVVFSRQFSDSRTLLIVVRLFESFFRV